MTEDSLHAKRRASSGCAMVALMAVGAAALLGALVIPAP